MPSPSRSRKGRKRSSSRSSGSRGRKSAAAPAAASKKKKSRPGRRERAVKRARRLGAKSDAAERRGDMIGSNLYADLQSGALHEAHTAHRPRRRW